MRSSVQRHNHGLHPTRLLPLVVSDHTRFQGVLWRMPFHETRRAGEANRYAGESLMALIDTERSDKNDHKLLALWAADYAERVLPPFQNAEPEDDWPRNAIEAARAWACGDLIMTKARGAALAAHAAARNTDDDPARLAARAAGHAAATAHVVGHAQHAANYAVKAMSATPTTNADEEAISAERDWQYRLLPEHLRPLAIPGPNRYP